jgi:hypothetical protein
MSMKKGNSVVHLVGTKALIVLRPTGTSHVDVKGMPRRECFVVGEAYVHGIMKGEAFNDGLLVEKE